MTLISTMTCIIVFTASHVMSLCSIIIYLEYFQSSFKATIYLVAQLAAFIITYYLTREDRKESGWIDDGGSKEAILQEKENILFWK